MANIDELSKLTDESKETYKRLLDLEGGGGEGGSTTITKAVVSNKQAINLTGYPIDVAFSNYSSDYRLKPSTKYKIIGYIGYPVVVTGPSTSYPVYQLCYKTMSGNKYFTTDANGDLSYTMEFLTTATTGTIAVDALTVELTVVEVPA